MVEAGKLRRSRAILPPDAKTLALAASPNNEGHENVLPPGCTIINRNPDPAKINTTEKGNKSLGEANRVRLGQGNANKEGNYAVGGDRVVETEMDATAASRSGSDVVLAVNPAGHAAAVVDGEPSYSGALPATVAVAADTHQSLSTQSQRLKTDSTPLLACKDNPPVEPQPSEFKRALASTGAFLGSLLSTNTTGSNDDENAPAKATEVADSVSALSKPFLQSVDSAATTTTTTAPEKKIASARAGAGTGVGVEVASSELKARLADQDGKAKASMTLPPSKDFVGATKVPNLLLQRYNPGPTYGSESGSGSSARGRKKKIVLNPAHVSADATVTAKEILVLVGDPALQLVSGTLGGGGRKFTIVARCHHS